jgi:hypothetical protein
VSSHSHQSKGEMKKEEQKSQGKQGKNKIPPVRIELPTGKKSENPLGSNLMNLRTLPPFTLHIATIFIALRNADK